MKRNGSMIKRMCLVLSLLLAVRAIVFAQESITITANGVSFQMVYIEGGTFSMGATDDQRENAENDEYPVHQVTVSSFYLGETEVTQQLWVAVMGKNPSYFVSKKQEASDSMKRPVEQVSWDDCQVFILELNRLTGKQFRLPTEAEWEFAARGGTKTRKYKYSGSNRLKTVAWCWENTGKRKSGYGTHEVKTKKPNELGLYDMSGNVWEWCQDWYGIYYGGPQVNPKGAPKGDHRIGRGGGWAGDLWDCRVSYRGISQPSTRSYYIGLRLAL